MSNEKDGGGVKPGKVWDPIQGKFIGGEPQPPYVDPASVRSQENRKTPLEPYIEPAVVRQDLAGRNQAAVAPGSAATTDAIVPAPDTGIVPAPDTVPTESVSTGN